MHLIRRPAVAGQSTRLGVQLRLKVCVALAARTKALVVYVVLDRA